ncbi:MAG: hypothetical protein ACR2KO_00535 [Geodermatophilaceae bacterium]
MWYVVGAVAIAVLLIAVLAVRQRRVKAPRTDSVRRDNVVPERRRTALPPDVSHRRGPVIGGP